MIGRSPSRIAIALLLALACAGSPRLSHALAPLTPALIYPMTYPGTLINGCGDGARGAIVVWKDDSLQVLRALHLLPGGDVDPAWPFPATVCSVPASRFVMGIVADGLGGAYVWWLEGAAFVLTRIAPDGTIAAGWPARGRIVEAKIQLPVLPSVISDGANGVYAGFIANGLLGFAEVGLARVLHIGPDNRIAMTRVLAPTTLYDAEGTSAASLSLARAIDGGLWAAVGMFRLDPATWEFGFGDWRLLHLNADGRFVPDGDDFGAVLRTYLTDSDPHQWNYSIYRPERLAAIVPDGTGGALVVLGAFDSNSWCGGLTPRVFPRDRDGAARGDQGVALGCAYTSRGWSGPQDHSDDDHMRVIGDGAGGLLLGTYYASDVNSYAVVGPGGSVYTGPADNVDFAPTGHSGFYVANDWPRSDVQACDRCGPSAALEVEHSELGQVYREVYRDTLPYGVYFGDLALVSATAESPWLVWSQVRGRPPGLYVMQLPTAPGATGVPDAPALASRFTARFARGEGVLVRGATGAAGGSRLLLADVAGRVVASERVPADAGAGEWRVPATASLPAGLYFARLTAGRIASTARVIVIR